MKAIDTNVLVRFLVRDDDLQAKAIYSIFKQAEANKEEFWVPLLVVLEILWVLESVYEIPRKEILDSMNELILMPILKFENQSVIQRFIFSAREGKIDLSDLLIAHSAKFSDCDGVLTFDKRASKFELFELVSIHK
ncbi:MAG: type II toxin-antitoxin system VapC family toxin [Deltaproteobacteria bacterium]|nr:type II toxin-antitoxin system VapC family toxin [Deltaproteobacteria bacterium]